MQAARVIVLRQRDPGLRPTGAVYVTEVWVDGVLDGVYIGSTALAKAMLVWDAVEKRFKARENASAPQDSLASRALELALGGKNFQLRTVFCAIGAINGSTEAPTRYTEAALINMFWPWSLLLNGTANVTSHAGFSGDASAGPLWTGRFRNARHRVLHGGGSEADAEAVRQIVALDRCWEEWAKALVRVAARDSDPNAKSPDHALLVVASADWQVVTPPRRVFFDDYKVRLMPLVSECLGLGVRQYKRTVRQDEDGDWSFVDPDCPLRVRAASPAEISLAECIKDEAREARAKGSVLHIERIRKIFAECDMPLAHLELCAPILKRRSRAQNTPKRAKNT